MVWIAGFWGLAEFGSPDLSLPSPSFSEKGQNMQAEEDDSIESSLAPLCDIREIASGPCSSKLECSHL